MLPNDKTLINTAANGCIDWLEINQMFLSKARRFAIFGIHSHFAVSYQLGQKDIAWKRKRKRPMYIEKKSYVH